MFYSLIRRKFGIGQLGKAVIGKESQVRRGHQYSSAQRKIPIIKLELPKEKWKRESSTKKTQS